MPSISYRDLEAMPVHRERLGQLVVDVQADAIAFVDLDRRARNAAVEAPAVDDATRAGTRCARAPTSMSNTLTLPSMRHGMSGTSGVTTGTTDPALRGSTRLAAVARAEEVAGSCTCCALADCAPATPATDARPRRNDRLLAFISHSAIEWSRREDTSSVIAAARIRCEGRRTGGSVAWAPAEAIA